MVTDASTDPSRPKPPPPGPPLPAGLRPRTLPGREKCPLVVVVPHQSLAAGGRRGVHLSSKCVEKRPAPSVPGGVMRGRLTSASEAMPIVVTVALISRPRRDRRRPILGARCRRF